ncbi:putative multidrug resistance protein [Tricladium varicosporioides]|nr:putative multidrug resistance protein [Hymenoscyphus varicosporioides]
MGFKPVPNVADEEEEQLGEHDSVPGNSITTIAPRVPFLEILVLIADIIIDVGLLLNGELQGCPLAFASVLFSTYLLFLLAGRSYHHDESGLQSHSLILYAIQWLRIALVLSEVLVEKSEQFGRVAILTRLAIFTTLCLLLCTAPRTPAQVSHGDHALSDSKPGGDEAASLLSRLTFFWITALLWKAFRRTLETSDLYGLNRGQASALLAPRFRATTAATLPLIWRMLRFFKYDILKQGIWAMLTGIAVFIPPMLMALILQYLQPQDIITGSSAWLCVGGLLISGLVACFADGQCNWVGRKMRAKLRTILMSEIYAKVLRMSIAKPTPPTHREDSRKNIEADNQATNGNILNLISADVEVTTTGTFLLYRLLGVSGVIGVAFMIAVVLLNFFISRRLMAAQGHVLVASDLRIQASNELLHNIRTIKYCAWEGPFQARVLGKRAVELKRMRSRFLWWSIAMTFFHLLPFMMTVMTCFFYTIVWGNNMGTAVAFPALVIFGLLRIPLNRMAEAISFLLQAYVSLRRISKFLEEQEIRNYIQVSRSDPTFFGLEDATLTFPTSQYTSDIEDESIPVPEIPSFQLFQLQNLQIEFQRGELNVIYGPSGSGKSAILLALLGEMNLVRGQVFIPHKEAELQSSSNGPSQTIAYCPQKAWILNRSIRANILIGQPFIANRYETVIQAVALLEDLALLDQGDQTLAGEDGSRLSGGQKQRVSLARALYSQSEYILLDDCLSAVDSRTANHIFFHGIKGPLMHGRTCIFTTHQTQLAIPHSRHVVLLDSGRVKAQGTCEELVSAGFIDVGIMQRSKRAPSTASLKEKKFSEVRKSTSNINLLSSGTISESELLRPSFETGGSDNKVDYEESKAEGAVPWSVVRFYLAAMGSIWFWVMVLLGFAVQQLTALSTVLWIKQWALQYDTFEKELTKEGAERPEKVAASYYLIIYTAIGVLYTLITCCRDLLIFYGALNASSRIYERLLNAILYAKLLFFDRVPIGQIMNRLSSDIGTMDQPLPTFSISAFQIAASLVMVVILISTAIPAFLLVAIIIFLAYTTVARVYISGARDFKRIEAVNRSPLYQQFGESLAGAVSIRAYAQTWIFTSQNYKLVDCLNQPSLLLAASREWLSFQIGVLSSIISFTAGAFVLWSMGSISPGTAGLILTYSATFTESVLWFVHVYAIIQQDLNSIERIVEYTEVEQEAVRPLKKGGVTALNPTWPSQGVIRFHDYTTRYAPELEATLKNINFHVGAGERVAVVGRTGAGKSTLALALIRGLEADKGHIEIGGIDIASITLKRLRQAVTVVPQDPEIFDGSLRDNLDPLHQYRDEEILAVLRVVQLIDTISNSLDTAADFLSCGQRQLLCIARALLRHSRVLVLDEVTASVDHITDRAIQTALHASVAAGTTVLTIAHRLISIADYDRVVVLDAGEIVEQGVIKDLLGQRGGSMFRKLCEESGNIKEIESLAV